MMPSVNFLQFLDLRALSTAAVAFLPRLVLAALILVLFWIGYRVTRPALHQAFKRAHFEDALIQLLVDNVYRSALIIVAVVIAAGQIGVNILPALAGLGVVGVALGFAAQDSVANMISGFLIFWDKPFRVGDYVTVQDQYGRVDEITLRTTRIRTPANSYVVIPNRKAIETTLINHSKHGGTRVDIPIAIGDGESIQKARQVLLAAVAKVDGVVHDPEPDLVVRGPGTVGTDLLVRVWIADAALDRPVFFRTVEACIEALDQAGVRTPSPQIKLLLDQREALLKPAGPTEQREPSKSDEE